MASYYDYEELREKALNGTQDDINNLGEWFEQHGERYWNGEFYDVGEGLRLYPIQEDHLDEDGELIYSTTTGYELN